MLQKIEYARRQAVDAYDHASDSMDTRIRDEWLKTACMWEKLVRQYELLLSLSEPGRRAKRANGLRLDHLAFDQTAKLREDSVPFLGVPLLLQPRGNSFFFPGRLIVIRIVPHIAQPLHRRPDVRPGHALH
jgi:hypothetical protein